MNDLQQSNPIRIKLSLPLEIMTQLFVVGHEIKYRQRKGKKYRRAFFFYIQIRKTIRLPLTHWHVMGLSGFFPFLVLFSSAFTFEILQTTKFCVLMRKKGRKENPLLFIQPSYKKGKRSATRLKKAWTFWDHLVVMSFWPCNSKMQKDGEAKYIPNFAFKWC